MTAAERSQRWREKNREKHRESTRRWRERNKDKIATRRAASRDQERARSRERTAADPGHNERARVRRMRYRHGLGIAAASAAMWEEQGGKCYLCGIYLVPWRAYIDHDHRCCGPDRTCDICRRGLTCDHCNTLIGMADDDPALLRLIADNLEARVAIVNARLAGKPRQLAIWDGAR